VDVPSLVITGGRDLPYHDALTDLLLSRIRESVALRLPRAGHMANMEDPDAVNRGIAGLVERVSG
jgi:pimeloyl-ACP methyl ester carboxylesterase